MPGMAWPALDVKSYILLDKIYKIGVPLDPKRGTPIFMLGRICRLASYGCKSIATA